MLSSQTLPDWVWDVREAQYQEGIAALEVYVEETGTSIVSPQTYTNTEGFNLGAWASSRRGDYKKGKLSDAKIKQVEAFPGWVWDTRK